jgi:biotin-(acetyl-CoA carboxylase) ligase
LSSTAWVRKKTRLDPRAVALEMASSSSPSSPSSGGAAEGTVIQGTATARSALSFSVILRPRPGSQVGILPLIATFCASEGIRKDTGIITWIRWPDEVVAARDVLAVTSLTPGGSTDAPWVVLSFLINLGHTSRPGSTSLRDLLGVDVDPDMLVAKVVDSLSWMHSGWVKEMYPKILPRITSMLENGGGEVTVDRDGVAAPGVVRGVDEKGRLIVDLPGGEVRVRDRSGLLRS